MLSGDRTVQSSTLAAALFLTAALAAASPDVASAQDKSMTIKLATASINDAQHEWMRRFAAAIEKNTNGRIKAELYPASQLGTIPRMIEMTQLGSIQFWFGPPEFLVGIDRRFELLSAPGVFQNDQQALKTITDPEFSKAFLAIGAGKGLVGTSMLVLGPTSYAMRTPLRTAADFKGKKIRVLASPFQTEQIARLGGTGIPMTLSDVLPALQQGTIDGAFNTLPVFTAFQYQDAARYVTETGQSYIFSIAVASRRWFDALPADLQEEVMSAAKQTAAEVAPWSFDFLASQRKAWTDKGGELIALPAADKAALFAKLATVGEDIVRTKPDLKPLWERMVGAAKR